MVSRAFQNTTIKFFTKYFSSYEAWKLQHWYFPVLSIT